jgi:hypothetical protein
MHPKMLKKSQPASALVFERKKISWKTNIDDGQK